MTRDCPVCGLGIVPELDETARSGGDVFHTDCLQALRDGRAVRQEDLP